jgi:Na+-translocating ferredoxin:NAD+ oxidoreductase RnfG subunit
MSRKHLFPIVALLAAAAVAGLLALTRTTQLGASASQPSSAQITAKTRSLDRLEAAIRRELGKQAGVSSSQPAGATASPRTVYVRAAAQPQSADRETEHGDNHTDQQERGDHDD